MLLEQDQDRVSGLADELKELNDVRKDMTAKGETEAIEQVERFYMSDKVLVVFLPECHESLAGIIAGRLREHFHKPSFVLTRGEQSAKGSCSNNIRSATFALLNRPPAFKHGPITKPM